MGKNFQIIKDDKTNKLKNKFSDIIFVKTKNVNNAFGDQWHGCIFMIQAKVNLSNIGVVAAILPLNSAPSWDFRF